MTRINVGRADGGTATNIIPETASIERELRGETTELREYMEDRIESVLENAARLHSCEVDVEFADGAPSAEYDRRLTEAVAAREYDTEIRENSEDALGGSSERACSKKRWGPARRQPTSIAERSTA